MPIDFSPVANMQPVNLAQIYGAADQANNQKMQSQVLQMQIQKAQKDQSDADATKQAFAKSFGPDGKFDNNQFFQNLSPVNPELALKYKTEFDKNTNDAAKTKIDTDKSTLELKAKKLSQARDELSQINDPVAYADWVARNQADPDNTWAKSLSPTFTPQVKQQYLMTADKALEQFKPNMQKVVDGNAERFVDTNPANNPAITTQKFAKPEDYNKPFLSDGTPNKAYQDFKQKDSKASAANVSVTNKLDLKTGEGLAKEIGPMVAASKSGAEGALQTLATTKTIDNAINSGKLIAGPFTGGRIKLLQVGQMLGVNGADDNEKLANTRGTIQGLAQLTLAGRSSLKGQGQISDYEGKLLAKASSGDLEDLTVPELKVISNTAKRVAKAQQDVHARNMKVMRSKPELADVADFYDVPTDTAEPTNTGKIKSAADLIKARGW
jgi:hypothetical protein